MLLLGIHLLVPFALSSTTAKGPNQSSSCQGDENRDLLLFRLKETLTYLPNWSKLVVRLSLP